MTKIEYYGREGRRTPQGYQMVHVIHIDGEVYEIQAATREQAIAIAQDNYDQFATKSL